MTAFDPIQVGPPIVTGWDVANPPAEYSTFDSLTDVDPTSRAIGDTLIVEDDGKLGYIPQPQNALRLTISAASNTWVLDHNLGYDPAGIRLFDSSGEEFEAEATYPIQGSRVVITFPFGVSLSGTAYLS